MKRELEPLAPDVLALLRAERPIVDLEPAAKAAILASVEALTGLPPVPGGGGGGGGGGGDGGGGVAGGAGGAAGAVGLTRVVAALLATFAAGVATGVVVAPRLDPPRLVQSAPAVSPTPITTTAAMPASAPLETVPVSALPSARTTTAPRAVTPVTPEVPAPSARGLGAERSLLDVARSALARGEAVEALAAVDRHALDYPDGALVEEREALAIKSLVALGRRDEAVDRAARFERRFPNGLLLRAVRGAVGAP